MKNEKEKLKSYCSKFTKKEQRFLKLVFAASENPSIFKSAENPSIVESAKKFMSSSKTLNEVIDNLSEESVIKFMKLVKSTQEESKKLEKEREINRNHLKAISEILKQSILKQSDRKINLKF